MSNNCIRSLEGLNNLQKLYDFDISHNQLSSLDGIEKLPNIGCLDVSHNKIQNVSDVTLQFLKDQRYQDLLEHIDLSNNVIDG